MSVRDQLPEHPLPQDIHGRPTPATIRIQGLVAHAKLVDLSELAELPRRCIEEPFACAEGWTVPGLRWEGVALADVLATAEPKEAARFVRVCSGAYTISLPLSHTVGVLLCDTLNGLRLPIEHGGPWRLLVPGGQCFSSVKWVDRLELTADERPSTGERIARQRLGSRA
ncbi:MAG: molybdopterin-dependent oxidoreductase [Chloroflexota bacterium]